MEMVKAIICIYTNYINLNSIRTRRFCFFFSPLASSSSSPLCWMWFDAAFFVFFPHFFFFFFFSLYRLCACDAYVIAKACSLFIQVNILAAKKSVCLLKKIKMNVDYWNAVSERNQVSLPHLGAVYLLEHFNREFTLSVVRRSLSLSSLLLLLFVFIYFESGMWNYLY